MASLINRVVRRSFSQQQAGKKIQNNPYVRANLNKQGAQEQQEVKKAKFIEEKRSWAEVRVELSRKVTQVKLKVIPFLKTLDLNFFVRLVFFSGVVYICAKTMGGSQDFKVPIEDEGSNSPNKFSKTFGQEKRLDNILVQIREEEENKQK